MCNPADLPCRTSPPDLSRLNSCTPSRSSTIRLAAFLRRAVLAFSLPTALLISAAVPSTPPVAVEAAPVSATVASALRPVAEGSLALGTPRVSTTSTGTVTVYALNLRTGPGLGYSVITALPRGTRGTVLGSASGWYRISTSRGTGWVAAQYFSVGATAAAAPSASVVSIARRYIGYPYVWGAAGPNAFDCSGFTLYVYRQAGITLAGRTAAHQYNTAGTRIRSYRALQPGDIIFFANTYAPGITHVGVYAGNGQMIDAANASTGVRITSINSSYYTSRFAGAIRPYR